ncbi:MAG: hypothetical protein JSV78_12755 [Phycisphaerales bacterium]|nr:MAG: hypothetical protein JSV78_12755 [Phycisphaerales bacterium]
MPIKIFASPGHHRDDFRQVEEQFNQWEKEADPAVNHIQTTMHEVSGSGALGNAVLTLVVHYDRKGS